MYPKMHTDFKRIAMIGKKYNSVIEIMEAFSNKEGCIAYLENLRWPDGVVSPYDSDSKVYKCKGSQYKCKNTGKDFNVRTGTIFDGTKVSLRKWMVAIWLMTTGKKGISSYQLARTIGVTQKTAWFMAHLIRACYLQPEEALSGVVQSDETFIGGKNRNRHWDKKVPNSKGRAHIDKVPVLGLVEQGGRLITCVIPDTTQHSITPLILRHVARGSMLYTDEWHGYGKVKRLYDHAFVDHSRNQYVNGSVTTNAIEGFWSIVKRSVIGVYHKVSRRHLQRYMDELTWLRNFRKESNGLRFNLLLCNMERKLTYKMLVHG